MRGFIKRLTSIVLAIAILFTSSIAGAQRTGGSFGGSSWGADDPPLVLPIRGLPQLQRIDHLQPSGAVSRGHRPPRLTGLL
jgi:hypothetical protein